MFSRRSPHKSQKQVAFLQLIIVVLLSGCIIQQPSGTKHANPSSSVLKIDVLGNLKSTILCPQLKISGIIPETQVPSAVSFPFTDLFGKYRVLRISFNRIDANRISYALQAIKSSGEPDPEVAVMMGSNNTIAFAAYGRSSAFPSDFAITVCRTLSEPETKAGVLPPSYQMECSLDTQGLYQGAGSYGLSASLRIPTSVGFGTNVTDSLGKPHRIDFKANLIARDRWAITLSQDDYFIPQADFKVGEMFVRDINILDYGKENFLAEAHFDHTTGKALPEGFPTYRIFFGNTGTSIVALDWSKLTCLAGENTIIAQVGSSK